MTKVKRHAHKVLFIAQDAGGFNSLAPVIERTRLLKHSYSVFLAGASRKFARERDILFLDFEGKSESEVFNAISVYHPCIIVAGTSGGVSIDKFGIKAAHRLRISSVAVLDFWINYNIRFSFDNSKRLDPQALPDHILIMDEHARREMMKEGFSEKKLVITGNPSFDNIASVVTPKNIGRYKILFVDQPISESIEAGWHENYGYTEVQVFSDLLRALELSEIKADIFVKLHPRTTSVVKYRKHMRLNTEKIRVRFFPATADHVSILKRVHLVFGMTSILLFESALAGKKVLSYQPGLTKIDPLVSNRLHLTEFVYKENELSKVLESLLIRGGITMKKKKLIQKYTKSDATGKVMSFIFNHVIC